MIRFLVGASFCAYLLSFLLPWMEASFPEAGFIGFALCIGVTSVIWNFIALTYDKAVARANAIKEVSKKIDLMMASGMSTDEIMTALNFKPEESTEVFEEPGEHIIKIQYDPLTEVSGYYNGEPIYNRIRLSNGRTATFDGVHDMKNLINPELIPESTMILESGIIYRLEKQDAA
jgi:hypothetical protein